MTTKDEVLKRAETNGKKAAIARQKHDESTASWFSKDTDSLCNYYPDWKDEIRETYRAAYKAEYEGYISPYNQVWR